MKDNKISVLLVEDNKIARKMGIIILEELNCHVESAVTGRSAIELSSQNNYDLILMDIGLPDIDGIFVIREIRNEQNINKDVPIIALSAHSDKEYIAQSFEEGATDFLVKPLSPKVGQALLEKYFLKEKSA